MITYIIEQADFETDDIDAVIDYCIDGDYHREDNIEDWINDIYPSYNIGGYSYSAYDILDRFDDLGDFLDEYCDSSDESDADEARWELRHATNGDVVDIQGHTVLVRVTEDADSDGDETLVSQAETVAKLREYVEQMQSRSKEIEQQNESALQNYLDLFQSM